MKYLGQRGRPKGSGKNKKPLKQTKPSATKPVKEVPEERTKFYCTRCPRTFTRQYGNFAKVRSPLYYNNGGYLHICYHCLMDLYQHYLEVLNDDDEAIKRICMKFDIYYNPAVTQMARNSGQAKDVLIKSYISKSGLTQVRGNSFDDTLDEENAQTLEEKQNLKVDTYLSPVSVSNAAKERWGLAFAPEEYPMLDSHYKMLSQKIENMDFLQKTFIEDLCCIKIQQNRAMQNKNVDDYAKFTKLYQDTLKQANLRVNTEQISEDTDSYGNWLSLIEKHTPAEYYKDKSKYRDFFGIEEYCERFIFRPLKNLLTGSKERDFEFNVGDDDAG